MGTEFYVGKRLSYDSRLCTVRYKGSVQGTKGEWLGVEWDDPTRGKHAGEHQGVKYFECEHSISSPLNSPNFCHCIWLFL
jgi:dynactin complex subunit